MSHQSRYRDERGAVIIHVAIAIIALLAFSAFVIDQGLMYASRRQAQNAADAGALAGAAALVFDGGTPAATTAAAQLWAANNVVWGEANSAANVDVTLSSDTVSIPPCGLKKGCVRVDVMRNMPDRTGAIRGNPLPVYFSHLVGLRSQGVRATATAETANGNAVRCLLPFGVIDRWNDAYDDKVDTTYFPNDGDLSAAGWTPNDEFQAASGDVYVPPYNGNPDHTGWRVNVDFGRQLIIKAGSLNDKVYSSGWALQVDLPNSTGSQDYKWNIENCNEQPVGIAEASNLCPDVDWEHGCLSIKTGMAQGPTAQGIEKDAISVVNTDPGAHWDPNYTGVAPSPLKGAIVDASGALDMSTSRIRPIAVIDIANYMSQGCSGTTCIGKVANIIGFFVEGMCKDVTLDNGMVCPDPTKDVVGRIVTLPGSFASGTGTTDDSAAFIKVIRLVR